MKIYMLNLTDAASNSTRNVYPHIAVLFGLFRCCTELSDFRPMAASTTSGFIGVVHYFLPPYVRQERTYTKNHQSHVLPGFPNKYAETPTFCFSKLIDSYISCLFLSKLSSAGSPLVGDAESFLTMSLTVP
ncbi:hypothetical protein Droror1_Dr00023545 [Drosera rotundifolia]